MILSVDYSSVNDWAIGVWQIIHQIVDADAPGGKRGMRFSDFCGPRVLRGTAG